MVVLMILSRGGVRTTFVFFGCDTYMPCVLCVLLEPTPCFGGMYFVGHQLHVGAVHDHTAEGGKQLPYDFIGGGVPEVVTTISDDIVLGVPY